MPVLKAFKNAGIASGQFSLCKLLLTNQRISCKQQMVQRSGLVVSAYIHVA
jgi:hypothetical protein